MSQKGTPHCPNNSTHSSQVSLCFLFPEDVLKLCSFFLNLPLCYLRSTPHSTAASQGLTYFYRVNWSYQSAYTVEAVLMNLSGCSVFPFLPFLAAFDKAIPSLMSLGLLFRFRHNPLLPLSLVQLFFTLHCWFPHQVNFNIWEPHSSVLGPLRCHLLPWWMHRFMTTVYIDATKFWVSFSLDLSLEFQTYILLPTRYPLHGLDASMTDIYFFTVLEAGVQEQVAVTFGCSGERLLPGLYMATFLLWPHIVFLKKKKIYLFLAALGSLLLHTSSVAQVGYSLVAVHGLLIAVASSAAECMGSRLPGFSSCGARASLLMGSVGIFRTRDHPCQLHWEVDY